MNFLRQRRDVRRRGRSRPGRQRGAMAVWVAMALPAFIICIGLGVDLAGHATAQQEARAVAGEAARVAGQYLEVTPGKRVTPQTGRAQRAAASYLASSSLSGTAVVAADGSIHIEVRGQYPTRFLNLIGVRTLPLRGEADAQVTTVVDGNER